jgi:hypothetical protein
MKHASIGEHKINNKICHEKIRRDRNNKLIKEVTIG